MKLEIESINKVLDETIRPTIMRDGGDLEIVSIEGNTVKINYKGACIGCPMAARGTLMAIKKVLQEKIDPNIDVKMA